MAPQATPPYSYSWPSANAWNGAATVQALARDASGTVLAVSQPVPVTINNPVTDFGSYTGGTLQITSPANNQNVSGTISWAVTMTPPSTNPGNTTNAIVYVLDGQYLPEQYSNSFNRSLDTRTLSNGPHVLFNSAYSTTPTGQVLAFAMGQVTVQVNNGSAVQALLANYRNIYLTPGGAVQLAAFLLKTDRTKTSATATYASDTPGTASVNASGLVTGVAQGTAYITLASGSQTTKVWVEVRNTSGFAHFSKDGHILTQYDPSRSIFVRSLFNLDDNEITNTAGLGAAVQAAGINALTTGFYPNPADNPQPDLATWKQSFLNAWNHKIR
jgi:hypothetical protein